MGSLYQPGDLLVSTVDVWAYSVSDTITRTLIFDRYRRGRYVPCRNPQRLIVERTALLVLASGEGCVEPVDSVDPIDISDSGCDVKHEDYPNISSFSELWVLKDHARPLIVLQCIGYINETAAGLSTMLVSPGAVYFCTSRGDCRFRSEQFKLV